MTEPRRTRVLVALEGAEPSSEALMQLARLFDPAALELTGLLVEDEDLLRAVQIPGFREVSFSGELIETDLDRMRSEMAGELRRLRQGFETTVRALQYRFRIEVARGRWIDSLRAAAGEADLVLVCRHERGLGLRPRAAPHFEPLFDGERSILIVNEPWASGHAVVVLGADAEALRVARRLAEPEGLELVVVVPRADAVPANLPAGSILVRVDTWNEATISNLARQWDARLLMAHRSSGADATLSRLLDHLPCSLLRLG